MINTESIKIQHQTDLINSIKPLSVLHILFSVNETSAPYNEHCLPMSKLRHITICTFFESKVQPAADMKVYEGNNSFLGFFNVLQKALKENKFDIIHVHALHLMVFFILFNILMFNRYLKRTVFTIHTSFQNFKLIHRFMLIPTFIFARRLVCCSEASRSSFRGIYKKLAGQRLSVVRNGADLNRIDMFLKDLKISKSDKCVISSVGRLIEVKNPMVLLKAFQLNLDQRTCLRFIGEGPLQKKLSAEIAQFKEQVEFIGLLKRDQVYKNLAETDIFVSASRVEGFPVATLEAMACGCPLILSDIPQHQEIAEGVDFIPLIHPDNIEAFASEMKRFCEMPDNERKKIGKQCRQLVEKRFSLRIMHLEYEQLYISINNK